MSSSNLSVNSTTSSNSLDRFDDDGTSTINDKDLQRQELVRLLSTAKDKDRQEFILKSLSSLETEKKLKRSNSSSTSPNSSSKHKSEFVPAIHPSTQARLFNNQKVPIDVFKSNHKNLSPKSRPMSARRGSWVPTNLDIIHENKWLVHNKLDHDTEIELVLEDVFDVCTSCVDNRISPKCVISGSRYKKKCWISTGLLPQFMTVLLLERWLLRKLEVTCFGVESLSVILQVDGKMQTQLMTRDIFSNDFVFNLSQLPEEGRKIFTLVFNKSSDIFFTVAEIRIKALPYA